MPRAPKKLTLIELMIVVAMVGILASIVLPAMSRAKRRTTSPSAATAPRDAPSEGQLNTIEPPQTGHQTPRPSAPARKPGFGWLFQLVLAGVVIRIIRALRARKTPPLRRKPERHHPPDADS